MPRADAVAAVWQDVQQGRAGFVAAAAELPAEVTPLWKKALADINAAIAASEPGARQVARVWGQHRLTDAARVEEVEELLQALSADVSARLDHAEWMLGELARALETDALPTRPNGISELAVTERKRELETILRRGHYGWKGTCETAAELLADALAAGDSLSAYLVAAEDGPLAGVYADLLTSERHRLRPALARAIRAARREPLPGEAFLRLVEAPHTDPGSWAALRTAILELVGGVGATAASLAHYAAGARAVRGSTDAAMAEQQRAATALQGTPTRAPELANLRMRQGAADDGPDLEAILAASRAPSA